MEVAESLNIHLDNLDFSGMYPEVKENNGMYPEVKENNPDLEIKENNLDLTGMDLDKLTLNGINLDAKEVLFAPEVYPEIGKSSEVVSVVKEEVNELQSCVILETNVNGHIAKNL